MSASEAMFLVVGLLLGVAAGATLVEILRARPPVPREVRLTVATDVIPRRRSATLAEHAFSTAIPEPARGGPADRRGDTHPGTHDSPDRRTAVHATTLDVGDARPAPVAIPILTDASADPRGGIPFEASPERTRAELRASLRERTPSTPSRAQEDRTMSSTPSTRVTAVAVLDRPIALAWPADVVVASADDGETVRGAGGDEGSAGGDGSRSLLSAAAPTDACAGERRIAAERCGLAVRSRASAQQAADAIRVAQRTYDDHLQRAEAAESTADPLAVRREKELAQARFRTTYDRSHSTDDAEGAARDWLVEINDINAAARTSVATAKRERAAAATLGAMLERMVLDADAARIAAESAEGACLAARQSVAECEERAAGITPAPSGPRPAPDDGPIDEDEPLPAALSAGDTPMVFRLIRGDRSALVSLVERLGGTDAAARRKWQLTLSSLVDAIVAVSIEAGALEFPIEHSFWGAFTHVQDREIAQALASLGHRFDGLGGFADERVPSQRDLSLAMGYAGLDPMRLRQWPSETEMAALYRDVTVAADEHLAQTAGDLTLGELVALLGRRADGLAELWNEWGRVRPLLLEGA